MTASREMVRAIERHTYAAKLFSGHFGILRVDIASAEVGKLSAVAVSGWHATEDEAWDDALARMAAQA